MHRPGKVHNPNEAESKRKIADQKESSQCLVLFENYRKDLVSANPLLESYSQASIRSKPTILRSAKRKPITSVGISTDSLMQAIKALHGEIVPHVDRAHTATHLVTDEVQRSIKFLVAVCKGMQIVESKWLDESRRLKEFIGMIRPTLEQTLLIRFGIRGRILSIAR